MPTYRIFARECWIQTYEVAAEDAATAMHKVENNAPDVRTVDDYFEYSHMLEPYTWTVEEVSN